MRMNANSLGDFSVRKLLILLREGMRENKEPIKRLKLIDSFQLCGKHLLNALLLFIKTLMI